MYRTIERRKRIRWRSPVYYVPAPPVPITVPVTVYYSQRVIYRLFCMNPNVKDCYVGSTSQIWVRIQHHKKCCEGTCKKQKVHHFINDNGGWENWYMEILEVVPKVWARSQVLAREAYFIERENATLNVYRPNITSIINVSENERAVTGIPCVLATTKSLTGEREQYLLQMQRTLEQTKSVCMYIDHKPINTPGDIPQTN
jgi:hypothetical protein